MKLFIWKRKWILTFYLRKFQLFKSLFFNFSLKFQYFSLCFLMRSISYSRFWQPFPFGVSIINLSFLFSFLLLTQFVALHIASALATSNTRSSCVFIWLCKHLLLWELCKTCYSFQVLSKTKVQNITLANWITFWQHLKVTVQVRRYKNRSNAMLWCHLICLMSEYILF